MHATRPRRAVEVFADGVGVVSHVGARLLAELADRTTLTAQLSEVFASRAAPQTAHDPGRVLVDVAVMLADGGECISDIVTLADQADLFGPVASDSTSPPPSIDSTACRSQRAEQAPPSPDDQDPEHPAPAPAPHHGDQHSTQDPPRGEQPRPPGAGQQGIPRLLAPCDAASRGNRCRIGRHHGRREAPPASVSKMTLEENIRHTGCCEGSCTHMWNYGQTIAHLFPELERSMRRVELGLETGRTVVWPSGRTGCSADRSGTCYPQVDGQLAGHLAQCGALPVVVPLMRYGAPRRPAQESASYCRVVNTGRRAVARICRAQMTAQYHHGDAARRAEGGAAGRVVDVAGVHVPQSVG
jgi:hypothetical protein